MLSFTKSLLLASLCLPVLLPASEDLVVQGEPVSMVGSRLSMQGGLRYQQGSALSLVYDGPFVLSELTWDIKSLVFVGGTARFEVGHGLTLVGSYWEALNEGNGEMTDYDFFIPGTWTDFSDGDVEINGARMLDGHLDWCLWQKAPFSVHAMLGYKHLFWDWSQYGGSYVYSEFGGFRNFIGRNDPEENGINYEQTFEIPYAGFALQRDFGRWSGRLYAEYSPMAEAEGFDEHVLRDLFFEDSFEDVEYYAAGLSVGYTFGARWYVSGALDWHDIPEIRGDVVVTDALEGGQEFGEGAAGIANEAWSLSCTVGMKF